MKYFLTAAVWGVSLTVACHSTPSPPSAPRSAPSAASTPSGSASAPAIPTDLLGAFADDYNNSFRITDTMWEQLPHGRFHIVEWHVAEQYFVARNDAANSEDANLWTRIDWVVLPNMAPYPWAVCMTAYKAPTRDSARSTAAPNRAAPRAGCNGYPFSRMRRPE